MTSSAPQGSVLGPTVLSLFIHDLPEHVRNQCKLHADDGKLIGIVKENKDTVSIRQDINELQNWANFFHLRKM